MHFNPSVMDISLVPNQHKTFQFTQPCFGKANPVKRQKKKQQKTRQKKTTEKTNKKERKKKTIDKK